MLSRIISSTFLVLLTRWLTLWHDGCVDVTVPHLQHDEPRRFGRLSAFCLFWLNVLSRISDQRSHTFWMHRKRHWQGHLGQTKTLMDYSVFTERYRSLKMWTRWCFCSLLLSILDKPLTVVVMWQLRSYAKSLRGKIWTQIQRIMWVAVSYTCSHEGDQVYHGRLLPHYTYLYITKYFNLTTSILATVKTVAGRSLSLKMTLADMPGWAQWQAQAWSAIQKCFRGVNARLIPLSIGCLTRELTSSIQYCNSWRWSLTSSITDGGVLCLGWWDSGASEPWYFSCNARAASWTETGLTRLDRSNRSCAF